MPERREARTKLYVSITVCSFMAAFILESGRRPPEEFVAEGGVGRATVAALTASLAMPAPAAAPKAEASLTPPSPSAALAGASAASDSTGLVDPGNPLRDALGPRADSPAPAQRWPFGGSRLLAAPQSAAPRVGAAEPRVGAAEPRVGAAVFAAAQSARASAAAAAGPSSAREAWTAGRRQTTGGEAWTPGAGTGFAGGAQTSASLSLQRDRRDDSRGATAVEGRRSSDSPAAGVGAQAQGPRPFRSISGIVWKNAPSAGPGGEDGGSGLGGGANGQGTGGGPGRDPGGVQVKLAKLNEAGPSKPVSDGAPSVMSYLDDASRRKVLQELETGAQEGMTGWTACQRAGVMTACQEAQRRCGADPSCQSDWPSPSGGQDGKLRSQAPGAGPAPARRMLRRIALGRLEWKSLR